MIISNAKHMRLRSNLKKEQVANIMDKSIAVVQEIEKHIDHAKLYHLELYANAIGCKVKDLFKEEKENE